MAVRNRRFTFAAITLPFLFIAMGIGAHQYYRRQHARQRHSTISAVYAGTGPFPLVVTDLDGDQTKVGVALALSLADIYRDAALCFDVMNAIVGNQIPTPGHGVRRGVPR